MSLDLGELAGRLMLDIGPLKRDVAESKTELRGVVSSAEDAGNDAGTGFSRNWGDSAKKGAVAAGAAFGTAVVIGLHGAMDREASAARLTAQLGLSPKQQEHLGRLSGSLYAHAYGDSIDQVNDAIGAVRSSMRHLDHQELRSATRNALNFASAFDVDVARSVQVVSQLVSTGLVKNAHQGFNLLIAASQKVPAAIREDLLDASDEYGQFFASLGYDGQQAFGVLVDASAKGMYGIDKAGDAVKEFTIRSTDMSAATKQAYRMIGVDWREMTDDILAGGEKAHDATQKIVQGILDIENPAKRSQAALALFGTPLEDLNTRDIPKFLRGLKDTGHRLDDVKGSAKDVNTALGTTADADFTKLKRRIQGDLIGVMEKALPVLEDDVLPAIEAIGDGLEKIPSWAVKGTLGGLLGLYAAGKLGSLFSDLRGLRGGLSAGGGIAGKVASKLDPVPVFVVNELPGGGVPGGGGKVPGIMPWLKGVPPETIGRLPKFAPFIPVGLGSAPGQDSLMHQVTGHGLTGGDNGATAVPPDVVAKINELNRLLDVNIGDSLRSVLGQAADVIGVFAGMPKKLVTQLELEGVPESKKEVKDLIAQYDLTPTEMKTLFDQAGIPNSIREVQNLIAQQSNVPKQVETAFHMNGIAAAISQIASLESRIDGLKGRGDHVLPYTHGGQSSGRRTSGDSPERLILRVGEKDMDAYVDGRSQRQIDAQDDWRAAVGG